MALWLVVLFLLGTPLAGEVASPYYLTPLLKMPQPLPLAGGEAELRAVVSARMNRSGQIALLGRYARSRAFGAPLGTGLFQLDGAAIVPLLLEDQQTAPGGPFVYSNLRGLLLNDSGTTVVSARRSDSERDLVLRLQGARLEILAEGLATDLNNSGQVLIESPAGLWLWTPGGVVAIAGTGQWIRAGGGALNDAGQVVFLGEKSQDGAVVSGVWLAEGPSVRLLVKAGDWVPDHPPQTFVTFSNASISERGTVAFAATTAGRFAAEPPGFNSRGVYVWQQGTLSVVGPAGPFRYDTLPKPSFDAEDRLYWADATGVFRWRWPEGPGWFVRFEAGVDTPDTSPSGLMLLRSQAGDVSLLSTLVLANAATPDRATTALSGGSLGTLYGNEIGEPLPAVATRAPLPTLLDSTQVRVGGRPAPLLYTSAYQVNFQAPAQAAGNQVIEVLCGAAVCGVGLALIQPSPALFPAAINQNGSRNGSSRPARRGEAISLFGTGVTPAGGTPADGEPPPASGVPLYHTVALPLAWVGSQLAQVAFSGLAPGLVGVWQVNLIVPPASVVGLLPVRLNYSGVESNSVLVAVQ